MQYGRSSDIEQLVEQTHLAIVRGRFDMAKLLLAQVDALDPGNADAQRLHIQLAAEWAVSGAPPRDAPSEAAAAPAHGAEPTDEQAAALCRMAADELRRQRMKARRRMYFPHTELGDARFDLSDHLFGGRVRRMPRAVICIICTALGAIGFSMPGSGADQLPFPYALLLGAFVGAVIGLVLFRD